MSTLASFAVGVAIGGLIGAVLGYWLACIMVVASGD